MKGLNLNPVFVFMTVAFAVAFSSCQTYRYKPTAVNACMFEQKGDMQFGFGGSELVGIHAAYAVTDRFGIMAQASGLSQSDSIVGQDSVGNITATGNRVNNHNDIEFAAMYFNNWDGDISLEVQGGFAFNNRVIKIQGDGDFSSLGSFSQSGKYPLYNRYFIQPAVGKNGKFIDWNFAMRMQYINYLDVKPSFTDMTIEPVFTVRGGYKFAKLMFQIGGRAAIPKGVYAYVPIHIGFGITVPLNQYTLNNKTQ